MSLSKLICSLSIMAFLIALSGSSCPTIIINGPLTGNVADGRSKYTSDCASCHSLGDFDTSSGIGGSLRNKGDNVVNDLGDVNFAMSFITLSDTEVDDLRAFIATIP